MEISAILGAAALCGIVLAPLAVTAQPVEDPKWPCVQRKVAELSVGLMWPHPIEADGPATEDEEDLIETLSLRRVTLEEAEARVAGYVARHPDTSENDLGQIFQGVFDHLARDRRRIVAGIERYADNQHELSARIDARRAAFHEAEQADPPDYDRLDELEAAIDWDERIFKDRAQSLTYVCETPVLLEQRLYGIAQMLLRQVQ
jgi:hypothetical protein